MTGSSSSDSIGARIGTRTDRWLLPEGIEQALPGEARRLEDLRRRMLDLFDSWGYEQVITPLVDYLESLLTDADEDLNLQVFKLTDQASGRMLGIRADMTPQVARMDAHLLHARGINRLCYADWVLKARGEGLSPARSLLQFGAEIYGHDGVASSLEVIRLMLAALDAAGADDVHVDLGHVGICLGFAQAAGLAPRQSAFLLDLLNTKATHEIETYLRSQNVARRQIEWFTALSDLYGGVEVLRHARERFADALPEVLYALDELETLADALARERPDVSLHCNLAELPGYHYESGLVFAAYVPSIGQEIARGGRYNNVGESFGKGRPAVGFSGDLKLLASLGSGASRAADETPAPIFAPADTPGDTPAALHDKIANLRAAGERVVTRFDGDGGAGGAGERVLVRRGDAWVVEERSLPAGDVR